VLDPIVFAKEILLDIDDSELQLGLDREREAMWRLLGQVEVIEVVGGFGSVVTLSNSAYDIKLVAWNGKFLTRVSEEVLDALRRDWKLVANSVPENYAWRGEVQSQQIRLYPPPANGGLLQVIKLAPEAPDVTLWHNQWLALSLITRLAISDPLRARLPLADLVSNIQGVMLDALGFKDFRSSRR
jgi:hypothetical protein